MIERWVSVFVAVLCSTPCAVADESFRVARPTEQTVLHKLDTQQPPTSQPHSTTLQQCDIKTDQGMLGQYIFVGMRTPLARDNFGRWRQNFCDPIICNMVLCNGSCGDFEEHCPSLSDSNRAIHIRDNDCMHPSETSLKADGKECCGNIN